MNALMYALQECHFQIPEEILQAAFNIDEQSTTINLTSLDDKILRKCVRKRVLLDANIVGGMEVIVPLNNITPLYYENNYTVYQIPPELTMNREIVSVLSLTSLPVVSGFNGTSSNDGGFGTGNGGNSSYGGGFNPIMAVANRIGDSAAISGIMHEAHLELVGFNTVLVYAHYRTIAYLALRVVVENESNLNNIQPRSYKNLSMLCVLGVKAYIYNKLSIAINSGYLSGGQDLGMFKNIIDSYSSAEEDYRVYLREVWAGVAYMNDTTRYNRLLGSLISPDL